MTEDMDPLRPDQSAIFGDGHQDSVEDCQVARVATISRAKDKHQVIRVSPDIYVQRKRQAHTRSPWLVDSVMA